MLTWTDVVVTFEGSVIMEALCIGLAQIDCAVGDLEGNKRTILEHVDRARELRMDVVSCPELVIPGYAPEDHLRAEQSFEHTFLEVKYGPCRLCF